ncbi:MAG TPA: AsnC family transcriptional regulator [Bacillota bacterium]|nr:AsnC family transcriptional regulator [Bacillota bacterium]
MEEMDAINRRLINLLQKGLPLEKNPYGLLAEQLEISRAEVLERIRDLSGKGYIRRLGGVFNNSGMGYASILFGIRVPEDILDPVAAYINSFKGVTHNYQRSDPLNVWFIFSFSDPAEKESLVRGLRERFAIPEILEFPKLRNYKLNVYFDLEDK